MTRLLKIVLEEQVSGALIVTRGDTTRTLYIKGGMITYATSTESQDRLGEIFIVQGKLTQEEVRGAFKKARRKKATAKKATRKKARRKNGRRKKA